MFEHTVAGSKVAIFDIAHCTGFNSWQAVCLTLWDCGLPSAACTPRAVPAAQRPYASCLVLLRTPNTGHLGKYFEALALLARAVGAP